MKKGPKDVLDRFMNAWEQRDFKSMAKECQLTWWGRQVNPAEVLETLFGAKVLHTQRIWDTTSISSVMMDIVVLINYKIEGRLPVDTFVKIRMIREKKPYETSTRGKWGVNPISALREEVAIENLTRL